MDEGLPATIPFLPRSLLSHDNGHLVIGMDGEFLRLDDHYRAIGEAATPFPMRVSHAVHFGNVLFATWIDGELMLARMGSMNLDKAPEDGAKRAELRTSNELASQYHPKGNRWSHVLNAEPLALAASESALVFNLWKRGLYALDHDAKELWRQQVPTWNYTKRRPRNEEILAIHIHGDELTITSRGGRAQRRSLSNGELLEEYILNGPEGPLEHHFRHENQHLICSTQGELCWLDDTTIVQRIQLNGPVQGAIWDPFIHGWRLAGWREEVIISHRKTEQHAWEEIPIHIQPVKGGAMILFNNGTWLNSHFESPVAQEEE
ncbi:MAG: hypothetical protein ISP85_03155 [Candidatus Poseidonia sp.]|nr:hypothetical protein [Poseidonia sp.]